MDRNLQLRNLGEQLERMKLLNAGVSHTRADYQIRALEESNAALTSRLMLVEGTVKTQERLLRDVINHLRNTGGDNTIMQENEHSLKMRALQGEVTMREQMIAQLNNEAAKQQTTLGQLLASMEGQTEETTRTNENQTFKSYSTFFFIPNISNKSEQALPSATDSTEKAERLSVPEKVSIEDDNAANEKRVTQNYIKNKDIAELTETGQSSSNDTLEHQNSESDNKENKETMDMDREKTYTDVIYDELESRGSFTAFPNEEGSLDDSSSWGNESIDNGEKRRESLGSGERMPRTPRSGQKTRRSLNEKPRWRR